MYIRIALALVLLPVLAAPCGAAGARAYARIADLDGHEAGRVRLTGVARGVLIEIEMHGLAPGAHAIAIHATGVCEGKFTSAGPILGAERPHGFLAKGGPRSGDLPNQFAAADGTLHAATFTTAFTLGDGVKSIFDADGAAIVVHAGGDDYLSQPEGRSGARIACGVIRRAPAPHR